MHGQEKVHKRKAALETDPAAFHNDSLSRQGGSGFTGGESIERQQQTRQLGTKNTSIDPLFPFANSLHGSMLNYQTGSTNPFPDPRRTFNASRDKAVKSACPPNRSGKVLTQAEILAIATQPLEELVDGYPPPVEPEIARLFDEFTNSQYEYADAASGATILSPEPELPLREAAIEARSTSDTKGISTGPTEATPQTADMEPKPTPHPGTTLEAGNHPVENSTRTSAIAIPEPMDVDSDPAPIRETTDNIMAPETMEEEADPTVVASGDEVGLVGELEDASDDEVL